MPILGPHESDKSHDIIRDRLLVAMKDYHISVDSFSQITGLDIQWLSDYLHAQREISELSSEKQELLFELAIFLSGEVKVITEDERIRGVIDVLKQVFGIQYESIASYAGLKESDTTTFMLDSSLLNDEKKYRLATTSLFLHDLFKNPDNPKT